MYIDFYQKLSASFGHASTHRAHFMQSGLSRISFTGSCIGQTFWQTPHSTHFSRSILSWYLEPPKVLWRVPMGQKEHQALGAIEMPNIMATAVVNIHIETNTMPTLSTTPCVPIIRKIMNPIRIIKTGTLIHILLRTWGILTLRRLIGPSQKSTKLPRGHRLPQNHLPRKGAIIVSVTKTSSRK